MDEPARDEKTKRSVVFARQFSLAMELPFLLAGSIVVGGAFGYLLDQWLGSTPFGMFLLGALGLYAGLRELLRRLRLTERKDGRNDQP